MNEPKDVASPEVLPKEVKFMIGAIAGSIAVWFSARSLITPPYVAKWAMGSGLCLAAISISVLTGMVIITPTADVKSLSRSRAVGIANILGLSSILLLFVFLAKNLWCEAMSPPKILRLKASPIEVAPGGYLEIETEAQVRSGDDLSYVWKMDGKIMPLAKHDHAQVKAPTTQGAHELQVEVSDGRKSATDALTIEVVAK